MTKQGSRRAFWLDHLRRWQAQGGTLADYARANDLPAQPLDGVHA